MALAAVAVGPPGAKRLLLGAGLGVLLVRAASSTSVLPCACVRRWWAQVATLVQADWLFLMTDVDCLYTSNPKVSVCATPVPLAPAAPPSLAPGPLSTQALSVPLRNAALGQHLASAAQRSPSPLSIDHGRLPLTGVLRVCVRVCVRARAPQDNPDAKPIYEVEDISRLTADTSTKGTQWGTGGMATKLTAGRIATAAGCTMVRTTSPCPHVLLRGIAAARGCRGRQASQGLPRLQQPRGSEEEARCGCLGQLCQAGTGGRWVSRVHPLTLALRAVRLGGAAVMCARR